MIPVSDLGRARAFYEDTLGLRGERGVELVSFDDGPQKTDERGIADLGSLRIAWFRDPDDNFISVFEPA